MFQYYHFSFFINVIFEAEKTTLSHINDFKKATGLKISDFFDYAVSDFSRKCLYGMLSAGLFFACCLKAL